MRHRLPPLRALQAFEAAARHMSFARAADELCVTPAAVSQQIKHLEERLGTTLFRRGAKLELEPGVAEAAADLTEAFHRLARAAERLIPEAGVRPLVVSVPPAFAARWLVPRLERFHLRHPDIDLRLSASMRVVDLDREGVDVAIRYGSGRYPGLHVERLRLEEVVAVAAPRLAAGLRQPADLREASLLVNRTIDWDRSFPDWPTWLRDMGAEGAGPLRLRQFDDAALVIEAALAGLGVALVWRTLVDDELASGRLIALFPGRPLSSAYHLVCPPDRLGRADLEAFRSWVMEEAGRAKSPI